MKNQIKNLLLLALLVSGSMLAQAETKIIAHRGFWRAEGSAQNSISSLQEAAKAGVYGSEFDVLLTSDGTLVVNHDDDIEGYVIEKTPYAKIKDIELSNGEKLPTLLAYLQEGKKYPELQLILEIKPMKEQAHENRAVAQIVEMVKELDIEKQVEYISFSMNVCEQLKEKAPNAEIAYLRSDLSPEKIKAKGLTGIDYYLKAFALHRSWIKEAQEIGISVNVWTVNETQDMESFVAQGVDYLTTDYPIEALEIANK